MFATIGWTIVKTIATMVVSYLVNMALAPKQNNKGPEAVTADEWDFPQADEGVPQCVFFGDSWTADWQVLAYGNYRSTPIEKS
ncbi:hypothetical protein [Phocoenobacter skyensis]|uniref:Uncharacterized protein n=1 Tax=Phocoenobacter skyensis TaxID=97481 RepID=A0ABT9JKZ0_9PAST|nr:hypothetical protein [Pasteurella skyensis]MDP8079510.1 hypothetical protein [Pasteurella skyensis]MDP8085382.1 hypothetical protein [Pasteurella skyensis]